MSPSLFLLWALVGWCGNEIRRIRIPLPPIPDPEPEPRPNWLVAKLIGVVAGIIGGWAFTQLFGPSPEPWNSAVPAAATAVGAFVVARIATDIYEQVGGGNLNRG
jgi:hypothetical protein